MLVVPIATLSIIIAPPAVFMESVAVDVVSILPATSKSPPILALLITVILLNINPVAVVVFL